MIQFQLKGGLESQERLDRFFFWTSESETDYTHYREICELLSLIDSKKENVNENGNENNAYLKKLQQQAKL